MKKAEGLKVLVVVVAFAAAAGVIAWQMGVFDSGSGANSDNGTMSSDDANTGNDDRRVIGGNGFSDPDDF